MLFSLILRNGKVLVVVVMVVKSNVPCDPLEVYTFFFLLFKC